MDQQNYEKILTDLLESPDLSAMFETMMSETFTRSNIMNPTTFITLLDGKMLLCTPGDGNGLLLKWKRCDSNGSPVSDLKIIRLFIPFAKESKDYISNVAHMCKNSSKVAVTTDTQQHVIIDTKIFERFYYLDDSKLSSTKYKIPELYLYRLPREIGGELVKMVSLEESLYYILTVSGSLLESTIFGQGSLIELPSPHKVFTQRSSVSNDSGLGLFNKCTGIDEAVYFISSGKNHTLCLTFGGSVLSRGSNKYGQCGITNHKRNNDFIKEFTKIPDIPPISRACCGYNHSVLLLQNKEKLPNAPNHDRVCYDVMSFGSHSHGQLGHGSDIYYDDKVTKGTPLPVKLPGEAIMISCCANHTVCAIAKATDELHEKDSPFLESELWGFGSNQYGQLGIPTISVIDTDGEHDGVHESKINKDGVLCYTLPIKIEFGKNNHPLNTLPNSVFCVNLLSTSEITTYTIDNSNREWIVGKDLFTSNPINLDEDKHIFRDKLYPISTPHNISRPTSVTTADIPS